MHFPPLENGLDYLQSVVSHLRDEPDARDLKYAVLHLQAATEVLLKVRLMREHWSLVFARMKGVNHGAFASGDFISTGLEETLERLKGIAGVELPAPASNSMLALAKERNKLQHHGLESQAPAIESLAGRVLDALLCFITDHLRPNAPADEETILDETQDLIREEMTRITALLTARLDRIGPDLDRKSCAVVNCPDCEQLALLLEEGLPCMFCDRKWDAAEAAAEYQSSVLGITWRDVTSGAEPALRNCPECDLETLVGPSVLRQRPESVYWICFNCYMYWNLRELDGCLRCGELMVMNEETGTVCSTCLSQIVERG